ncbi:hypothetical protein CBR_g11988 [Chara braunii]|uniref:Integrase catalytic domain-containing protein n=1 Tax=Chara braunii TaxID=69332 RepID=A0A388KQU9_CHABU|nr:hypothetical protein CBR_g11988 [Chara braunii]|eukprot:GBG72409.1 hypothetical protein CBR_g11988 [Chara braunii]
MLDPTDESQKPFFQKLNDDAVQREREAAAAARAADIADQVALLRIPEANADRFRKGLAAAVAALVRLRTLEDFESRMIALEQRNKELQAKVIILEQSQLSASRPPNPRSVVIRVSQPNTTLVPRASGTAVSAGTGASSSSGSTGSSALIVVPNAGTSAQNATVLTAVQYNGPMVDKRAATLPSKYDGKADITSWISSMRSCFEVMRTPQEDRSMIMGTNTEPAVRNHIELQAFAAGYARIDLTDWLKVTPVRTLEDLLLDGYQDKHVALKARLKLEALKGQTWRSSMQALEHLTGLFTTPDLGMTDVSCMDVVMGVAPTEYLSLLALKDHAIWRELMKDLVDLEAKDLARRKKAPVAGGKPQRKRFGGSNQLALHDHREADDQSYADDLPLDDDLDPDSDTGCVRITFDKDRTVTHELNFYVLDKCPFDAVIGLGWLKAHCLWTTRADNQFVVLDAKGNERTVLLDETREFPVTLLSANKFCRFVVVYLDDILIFSKSMEGHVKHLEEVLQVLKDAQLHLNLEKFEFGRDSVIYLGHRLSASGLEPEATKVEVIRHWPQPAKLRELRSLLDMACYYWKFVPKFSDIAHPLSRQTSKNVAYAWCEKCETAFQALKEALVSHPVLRIADPNLTFVVTTDASQFGIGAVLQEDDGDGLRPLEYYSKRMPSHKVGTSTYMRELYALREALTHWKHYLLGRHFKVYSDHQTLQWIKTQTDLSPTLTRWLHDIDVFNFELKHKKGCYDRVADALSRHPEYLTCLVDSYDLRRKLKEDLVEHTAKDPDLSPILEQLEVDPNSQPDFHECEGLVFRRHKPYGLLRPLPIPNGPGESISIDFTDMGKVSEAGNSHIVDRFSKFLNLIPLPPHAPTELVIEEFHQQHILQFGVPKTIVSDRDTRFISKDWKDFTSQIYDIKLNRTSGRHLEANGLAEEIN